MKFSDYKKLPPRERALHTLLDDLCVKWGFCIPVQDRDRIATRKHLSSEEFAAEVLLAEGMEPQYETMWMRRIGRLYLDKMS